VRGRRPARIQRVQCHHGPFRLAALKPGVSSALRHAERRPPPGSSSGSHPRDSRNGLTKTFWYWALTVLHAAKVTSCPRDSGGIRLPGQSKRRGRKRPGECLRRTSSAWAAVGQTPDRARRPVHAGPMQSTGKVGCSELPGPRRRGSHHVAQNRKARERQDHRLTRIQESYSARRRPPGR
jgi:hypothetical protein